MAKKMWGARFSKPTNPLVEEFSRSIHFDYKLAKADIIGSLAHVLILGKAGFLNNKEVTKLSQGLNYLWQSLHNNTYKIDPKSEDIHTDIQNKLEAKIGNIALKLHTARSRNDQVVFATKVYCKFNLKSTLENITSLIDAFKTLAEKYSQLIIPGFTHLQHAQPIYLKDYLGAYVEMLKRDAARIEFILKNIKVSLGAGAISGTPIDASKYNVKIAQLIKDKKLAKEIFEVIATKNSLDVVSDRDFIIEIMSALAMAGMHLSRLSEDLIIWSTKEFSFVDINDAYCTGSSLMPQKKNPDCLELIRGYSGRLLGGLVSELVMMKGLPLAYNRDMQLDKEPLFKALEIVNKELKILAGLVKTLKFNENKISSHLKDEALYATDLVYYLVKKQVAFREAHSIIGKLVKYSLDSKTQIKDLPENIIKNFSAKLIKKDIIKLFNPKISVESKKSIKR